MPSHRVARLPTLLAALALPACAPPDPPGPDPDDPMACAADPSWFPHADTPEPDSEGFRSDSQCAFHRWSWQAFLWLTQDDASGSPRFLSFATPHDLYGDIPTDGLLPRMGKSPRPETVDEFLQAGTDGIMTDQRGRPIYYSQYVDPVFEAFVRDNGLTDPDTLAAFPADSSFPIGAIELKASWKVVGDGEDAGRFFTMESEVARLADRGAAIVIDPGATDTVTLALVGFHVAGRVNGHPEMIWATFEHDDNAPDVFTHANIGDPPGLTDPVSDRDWTFYAAGTPRSGCNVNTASSPARRLDEATQTLTPVTQACREYEHGNLPGAPDDTTDVVRGTVVNDANIDSLNADVRSRLADDDVWSHYSEVGAIWFSEVDALRPGAALDGLCVEGRLEDGACVDGEGGEAARLIGSLRLSNSTIETFTQSQSTLYNCFRCHNTQQRLHLGGAGEAGAALPAKNINISHIIVNGFFRPGSTP